MSQYSITTSLCLSQAPTTRPSRSPTGEVQHLAGGPLCNGHDRLPHGSHSICLVSSELPTLSPTAMPTLVGPVTTLPDPPMQGWLITVSCACSLPQGPTASPTNHTLVMRTARTGETSVRSGKRFSVPAQTIAAAILLKKDTLI